jgi:carboxyl-terminal processing protease
MTPRLFFLVVSPLLLLAAALGYVAAEARARPKAPTIYWPEGVVQEMRSLVEENYVDEVPDERARQLFYAACKAWLGGLDDYCEFYTPEEKREMERDTQGEFGGVGILGNHEKGGIRVRGARIDDPAWKAGIRAGDLIVSVDGVDASGEKGADAMPRLRGEPKTPVRVAWMPGKGGERREAVVTRALVKTDSVVGVAIADRAAGIGYLRIVRFQENTVGDLKAALKKLRAEGARSFVLDLRSDYGGVLPAAVACADCFLGSGVVVVTQSRTGIERPGSQAGPDPDDVLDAPLVLLVDGNTASAAEVLAGALQDHRRAVLVGERTYGKFLVQRIVPLPEEDVAVRLTTARYYTPFGRNLQRDDARGVRGGIVPEIPVAVDEATRKAVNDGFADQVGLDWDLEPAAPGAAGPPEDPILARGLALLADAAALAPTSTPR